jgi:AcrR family transcriptional regulator
VEGGLRCDDEATVTDDAPPPERPKRRPRAATEARRDEILDAAVDLFSRYGFRGTGLIGLGKEVGLTHAALLYHFGTKQKLLEAVVARRDEQQGALIAELATLRGLVALRAIEKLGTDAVEHGLDPRLFSVLVAENLQPDDPLNGYFRRRYALVRQFVVHAVSSGQQDGEIRLDADPEATAAEVMGFVAGIQVEWLLDPEVIDLVAAYRQYLDRLERDLRV